MDLNTIWFVLIAILFSGFFLLEGFDYGVGILVPFLGKDAKERQMLIRTVAPFWDGNEVWILTAGGAIFAAFPHWYATMFSGYYLALALILISLIIRGIAMEYHGKYNQVEWRRRWEWLLCGGSFFPAVLWGVAISNLLSGVPINAKMDYSGSFLDLLNPYALIGGLFALCLFLLQGALFINLKTTGDLRIRSGLVAKKFGWIVALTAISLMAVSFPGLDRYGSLAILVLAAANLLWINKEGLAFVVNCLLGILFIAKIFFSLYPRVMVSSLNPDWNLTIYNAASSPYTLKVMTIVAVVFVPVVLGYQGWSYWVFRNRVTAQTRLDY